MKKYQIYYEGQLVDTLFANSSNEALLEFENMLQIRIKGLEVFNIYECEKDIFDYGNWEEAIWEPYPLMRNELLKLRQSHLQIQVAKARMNWIAEHEDQFKAARKVVEAGNRMRLCDSFCGTVECDCGSRLWTALVAYDKVVSDV